MERSSSNTGESDVTVATPVNKEKGQYAELFMQALDKRGPEFQKHMMELATSHPIFPENEEIFDSIMNEVRKVLHDDLMPEPSEGIVRAISVKLIHHTFENVGYTPEYRENIKRKLYHVFVTLLP